MMQRIYHIIEQGNHFESIKEMRKLVDTMEENKSLLTYAEQSILASFKTALGALEFVIEKNKQKDQ